MNRSDSYQIDISLTEADGITPLDLTSCTGLLVALYQNPNNVIAKYSKNAITGYHTLSTASKADFATGVIHIFADSVDLIKANPESKLYAEVVVEFANANFTGGVQRSSATAIELEVVNKTALHNQATS